MKSRNLFRPRIGAPFWATTALAAIGTLALNGAPLQAAPVSSESFYMNGRQYTLPVSSNWVGVQVVPNSSTRLLKGIAGEAALDDKRAPLRYAANNVLLLPVDTASSAAAQNKIRTRLGKSNTVRSLVRLYGNASRPFIDNGEFIVRFKSGVSIEKVRALLAKNGATPIRSLSNMGAGQYLARASDASESSLKVSSRLFRDANVEFSHPNFLMPMTKYEAANDPLYRRQWHLNNTGQGGGTPGADVRAQAAWDVTKGDPDIIIAVLDDGFDIDHEDFVGKVVPGYDFIDDDNDPRPVLEDDDHGTACAGVAAATGFNGIGVAGAAPLSRMMPVRMLSPFVTPLQQAAAFDFASGRPGSKNNGEGADIISNSYGPVNAGVPLPDAVRASIRYAVTQGRGGKGCVVLFAAGNDDRNADSDGYSANPDVISVAASTNLDTRAGYSNFGESIDICAPSNGGTLSITTVDRTGAVGYDSGDYTSSFGGTSSACPLAAGVAALLLSNEPDLTRTEVQVRLQETADKIDPRNGEYDERGHSNLFGFGRVNAARALAGAAPKVSLITPADNARVAGLTPLSALVSNDNNVSQVAFEQRRQLAAASRATPVTIPDFNLAGIQPSVTLAGDARPTASELTVTAEIAHSYIGDLQVAIIEPDGRRTVIYDHSGGDADTLSISQTLPAAVRGLSGVYTLQVIDDVQEDVGTLLSFSVKLTTPFTLIAIDADKTDNSNNQYTAVWDVRRQISGLYDVRAVATIPPVQGGDGARTFSDINSNIQVTGLPSRTYAISGTVIDSARRPVAGARIILDDGRTVLSDAQGKFIFSGVASGRYLVRIFKSGSIFTPEVARVDVGSADVSTLRFVLTAFDSVAPRVAITTPSAQNLPFSSLPVVAGTATDDMANGVLSVTIRIGRYATGTTPGGFYNPTTKGFDTAFDPTKNEIAARGTDKFGVALASLPEGRYALLATATDRAGNVGRSTVVNFFIDRTAPSVTITSPIANRTYALGALKTASGAASDNTGVASITGLLYRYATPTQPAAFFNGRTFVATNPGEAGEIKAVYNGRFWTMPLPSLSVGRYFLRATARDRAGNRAAVVNNFLVRSAPASALVAKASALSSASADASSSSVALQFINAIQSADAANFSVTVNGAPVAVESAAIGNGVTLSLPDGALQSGDSVEVTWSGLRSANGGAISDGATTVVAR